MISMPKESITKTVGLVVVIIVMFVFSYLFYLNGESNVTLILLFIGIILALVLAAGYIHSK